MRRRERIKVYLKIHNAMKYLFLRSYVSGLEKWKDAGDHEAFLILNGLDEANRLNKFEDKPTQP
jgi:hypothetical protein